MYTKETKHVLVLAQSFLLSLFPLPSSSVERLIDWEAPCALALVSARLELVGEPPGLVEGAVGGKALHGVLHWVMALDVGASVTAVAVIIPK